MANLLSVRDLKVTFNTDDGVLTAVDGVSFDVAAGTTLGLVGESGCGKTVSALAVMGLLPAESATVHQGQVMFDGEDLLQKSSLEMCQIRGRRISMIFQEPMTSLNPVYTVGHQVMEAISIHSDLPPDEVRRLTLKMLDTVGIPDAATRFSSYPHQLSGGLRQRVMIAMALACTPDVLIADEPTTALDVTIQAQILRLMRDIQRDRRMSVIIITHDLGVIAEMADEVCVMYAGQVVERGGVFEVFREPLHPYTVGLLGSRPYLSAGSVKPARLKTIRGLVPSMLRVPLGCRFAPRCDHVQSICGESAPQQVERPEGHVVRCHMHGRGAAQNWGVGL